MRFAGKPSLDKIVSAQRKIYCNLCFHLCRSAERKRKPKTIGDRCYASWCLLSLFCACMRNCLRCLYLTLSDNWMATTAIQCFSSVSFFLFCFLPVILPLFLSIHSYLLLLDCPLVTSQPLSCHMSYLHHYHPCFFIQGYFG